MSFATVGYGGALSAIREIPIAIKCRMRISPHFHMQTKTSAAGSQSLRVRSAPNLHKLSIRTCITALRFEFFNLTLSYFITIFWKLQISPLSGLTFSVSWDRFVKHLLRKSSPHSSMAAKSEGDLKTRVYFKLLMICYVGKLQSRCMYCNPY